MSNVCEDMHYCYGGHAMLSSVDLEGSGSKDDMESSVA